jgi:hypothetical protein
VQSRIIKKSRVKLDEHPEQRCASAREARKSARLLEEEGLVRAVEVTCRCGEKTVIELEYDSDPEPQS